MELTIDVIAMVFKGNQRRPRTFYVTGASSQGRSFNACLLSASTKKDRVFGACLL